MAAASPEMNFRKKALLLVGTLLSGVVTGGMVTQLPIAQATITSSVLLASLVLVFASASRRTVWWVGVGGTTGMIIGLGGIMSEHLAAEKEPLDLQRSWAISLFRKAGYASITKATRYFCHQLPVLLSFF